MTDSNVVKRVKDTDKKREFYRLLQKRDALIQQWERLEYCDNFEKDDHTSSAMHHRRKELHQQAKRYAERMIATIEGNK